MKVTPTWRAFAPPAPPAVWVQLSGGHAWEGTTPKAVAALAGSALGVRGEPCRVLLLGRGLEELPGAGYVAEGGSGSRPKIAARRRGSAPVAMASSSWRSTRRASMVAVWPRRVALTQVLLTGLVSRAVWALMSGCGLAVPGRRVRRFSSQNRRPDARNRHDTADHLQAPSRACQTGRVVQVSRGRWRARITEEPSP